MDFKEELCMKLLKNQDIGIKQVKIRNNSLSENTKKNK